MWSYIKDIDGCTVWLRKIITIKGFRWACQVYGTNFRIGVGCSKNKITSYRDALAKSKLRHY